MLSGFPSFWDDNIKLTSLFQKEKLSLLFFFFFPAHKNGFTTFGHWAIPNGKTFCSDVTDFGPHSFGCILNFCGQKDSNNKWEAKERLFKFEMPPFIVLLANEMTLPSNIGQNYIDSIKHGAYFHWWLAVWCNNSSKYLDYLNSYHSCLASSFFWLKCLASSVWSCDFIFFKKILKVLLLSLSKFYN